MKSHRIGSASAEKGFTLIELLIVIGIVGFLAAAVLVAVDPVKRIQDARDARRSSEANGLLNALLNQQTDALALFPGDTTASTGAVIIESASKAQVIVRSVSGIDCDAGGTNAPTCPQLPSGYSLDTTTAGSPSLVCVAKLDVAVQAPGALTGGAVTLGGSVNAGTHSYKVTFVTSGGESDAGAVSNTITTTTDDKTVALTSIPTAPAASGTFARKIYRTAAGNAAPWLLLTTINNNTATTYSDTTADGSLGAGAPASNATGLVPGFLAELPIDPGTSVSMGGGTAIGNSNSGYYVIRHPTSKRITMGACYGELNTAIKSQR